MKSVVCPSLLILSACLAASCVSRPKLHGPATGEEVLNRHLAALGGQNLRALVRSSRMKGKVAYVKTKKKGVLRGLAKAPDKLLLIQEIDGLGTFTRGYDGFTGWASDPFMGARALRGKEASQVQVFAHMHHLFHWRELFRHVRLLRRDELDGHKVYVVRVRTPNGWPMRLHFDAESFLLRGQEILESWPDGKVLSDTRYSDFREVAKVKTPFRIVEHTATDTIEVTVDEIEYNIPLSDDVFRMPKPARDEPSTTPKSTD